MSILSNAKDVVEIVKKLGDIELYRKIVELEGDIVELTREKRALEEENQQLKRSLEFSKNLVFKRGFYYAEGDPRPFCPRCWEVDRIAVHMTAMDVDGEDYYRCANCRKG